MRGLAGAVTVGMVALVAVVGCEYDDPGLFCGDYVANTAAEECDGVDLNGATCADVMPGSAGTLFCSNECTYDVSWCFICGNGILEADEACDCGTDASNLPAGCAAENGDASSICGVGCQEQD